MKIPITKNKELDPHIEAYIAEIFKDHPDAWEWIKAYNAYGHMIDDVIDERLDPNLVLRLCATAELLFSMPFYLANKPRIDAVNEVIRSQYYDSIKWEKSTAKYFRDQAKCLSHCGIEMFFCVIRIIAGELVAREVSTEFRRRTFVLHKDDSAKKNTRSKR